MYCVSHHDARISTCVYAMIGLSEANMPGHIESLDWIALPFTNLCEKELELEQLHVIQGLCLIC